MYNNPCVTVGVLRINNLHLSRRNFFWNTHRLVWTETGAIHFSGGPITNLHPGKLAQATDISSPMLRSPTPAGVPVKIRSPCIRRKYFERYDTTSGIVQIMLPILDCCLDEPFTPNDKTEVASMWTSSKGTIGPHGADPSNPLEAHLKILVRGDGSTWSSEHVVFVFRCTLLTLWGEKTKMTIEWRGRTYQSCTYHGLPIPFAINCKSLRVRSHPTAKP